MNQGWIRIYRDIVEHWLWTEDKPFDRRSAWIDLLILANHKDIKTFRKGKLINRKRGEVNLSFVQLADRWGWDRRKVKRFLSVLESDGMVHVDGTADGTTVTIENYNKYQYAVMVDGTADGTADSMLHGTADGTADGTAHGTSGGTPHGTSHGTPHGTHDKNDKECIKNDKEIIKEWEEGKEEIINSLFLNDDDDIPGLEEL